MTPGSARHSQSRARRQPLLLLTGLGPLGTARLTNYPPRLGAAISGGLSARLALNYQRWLQGIPPVALLERPFKKREAALPVGARVFHSAEFAPGTASAAESTPETCAKSFRDPSPSFGPRLPHRPSHPPSRARRLGKPGWWRVRLGSRERGGRGSSSVFVCV